MANVQVYDGPVPLCGVIIGATHLVLTAFARQVVYGMIRLWLSWIILATVRSVRCCSIGRIFLRLGFWPSIKMGQSIDDVPLIRDGRQVVTIEYRAIGMTKSSRDFGQGDAGLG